MRCSRCGKDIPFAGKVCPFCGTAKSKDQLMMVCGMLFAVVGGFLGYVVTQHVGWTLLVAFIGMVAGIILVQSGVFKPQPTKEDAGSLPEVKVREAETAENTGGRGIQVRCRSCKQLNDETAQFCNKCGAAM